MWEEKKMMLTFYLTSLAVAKFTHVHTTTFLYPRCLHVKGAWIKRFSQLVTFTLTEQYCSILRDLNSDWDFFYPSHRSSSSSNQLTHRCVKSNMLLVRVEVLVLLPTELTNIAPRFWRQEKTHKQTFVFIKSHAGNQTCVTTIKIQFVGLVMFKKRVVNHA